MYNSMDHTQGIEVPDEVTEHILTKHQDVVKKLNVRNVDELRQIIIDAVSRPDEVYTDRYRVSKYFLKKIDEKHWLNVVVQRNVVKTAYIIGPKTYKKFKRRQWL